MSAERLPVRQLQHLDGPTSVVAGGHFRHSNDSAAFSKSRRPSIGAASLPAGIVAVIRRATFFLARKVNTFLFALLLRATVTAVTSEQLFGHWGGNPSRHATCGPHGRPHYLLTVRGQQSPLWALRMRAGRGWTTA